MSASSPQPAALETALCQARDLGRRHGRAAAYWQVGDSSTMAAREFYQELLRGIASADPAITGLYEVPDLTARWDYQRGNLAADLGLADGDPGLDEAAGAFLSAAREEFWLEAARLARRRLAPGDADEDGTEPENPGDGEAAPDRRQDISDPPTGLSRLLSERCGTCILRPRDPMYLGPERTAAFIRQVLDAGSYVVCHQTLTYGDFPGYGPAICRGFFDAYRDRSPVLLILQAGRRLTEVPPPLVAKAEELGRDAGKAAASLAVQQHARGRVPAGAARHRRGRPRRPRRDRAARDRPRGQVRPGRPRPRPRHRARRPRPVPGRVRLRRRLHRRLLAGNRAGRPRPRRLAPGTATASITRPGENQCPAKRESTREKNTAIRRCGGR